MREEEKPLASWCKAAAPGRRVRRVYKFLDAGLDAGSIGRLTVHVLNWIGWDARGWREPRLHGPDLLARTSRD